MLNYIKEVLVKPIYQMSFRDSLVLTLILILALIFVLVIIWGVFALIGRYKEQKFRKCIGKKHGYPCWHCHDCLRCEYFKEKDENNK